MRHKSLVAALMLLATPALAQTFMTIPQRPSAITIANSARLLAANGGVAVILRLYGDGLATRTGSPNDYRTAFAAALAENQALIADTDARMAAVYASIYPAPVVEAELAFFDSPIGAALADKYRNGVGQIVWPGPGDSFLSPQESAALSAFNRNVQLLGDAAQKNPDAMDAVLSAETDTIIKLRGAANAKYCQNHDCAKEGIK